jgi:type VI protein secretion system component Hcp
MRTKKQSKARRQLSTGKKLEGQKTLKASTSLYSACCNGTHIKTATIAP